MDLEAGPRVLCCLAQGDPIRDGKFQGHYAHDAAMTSIREHAPQAEITDVTGSDYGYWREICLRWGGQRDLVIIEHDIMIGPGTVESLASCDQDWCVFGYKIFGCKRLVNALGCTKFSARLQREVPQWKIARRFAHCPACAGRGCWWHLDNYLAAALSDAGFAPHDHGDVRHLHDYRPGSLAICEGIATWFSWESGSEPVRGFTAFDPDGEPDIPAGAA